MLKEQFENYRFSINTEVQYMTGWFKTTEVWFKEGKIGITSGQLLNYREVEDIREATTK